MKIAFSGPLRAGKTTAAKYAAETYYFDIWSFAYYVRETLVMLGIPSKVAHAQVKSPRLRKLLQDVGTAFREYDPGWWLRQLLNDICELDEDMVIDDMRFPNEAEALRKEGFKLVRINCPGIMDDGDPARDHESEHALDDWDDWDAEISSEHGDVLSLYDQLNDLIEEWGDD